MAGHTVAGAAQRATVGLQWLLGVRPDLDRPQPGGQRRQVVDDQCLGILHLPLEPGAGPIEFKGIQMNTHYFWQKNFNIYTCI